MADTKLHIQVGDAVLDVEGDSELVAEMYHDFKEQLAHPATEEMPEAVSDMPGTLPQAGERRESYSADIMTSTNEPEPGAGTIPFTSERANDVAPIVRMLQKEEDDATQCAKLTDAY